MKIVLICVVGDFGDAKRPFLYTCNSRKKIMILINSWVFTRMFTHYMSRINTTRCFLVLACIKLEQKSIFKQVRELKDIKVE